MGVVTKDGYNFKEAVTCNCLIDEEWPWSVMSEDESRQYRCSEHKRNYVIMSKDGEIHVYVTAPQ